MEQHKYDNPRHVTLNYSAENTTALLTDDARDNLKTLRTLICRSLLDASSKNGSSSATTTSITAAHQRQVLMLLVGDPPADLFIHPHTGKPRTPRQICHAAALLLRPHRLERGSWGAWWTQNKARFKSIGLRVGQVGHLMLAFTAGLTLLGGVGVTTVAAGNVLAPSIGGEAAVMMSGTIGIGIISSLRWKNTWVGWYIWEHITTAWTKGYVASKLEKIIHHGVSTAKRAEMRRNSFLLQKLDSMVQQTGDDELRDKMSRYTRKHQSWFRLGARCETEKIIALFEQYHAAPNTLDPVFRQALMRTCPKILRGHHFMTSLGDLRPTKDIMKAYLISHALMEEGALTISKVAIEASLNDARKQQRKLSAAATSARTRKKTSSRRSRRARVSSHRSRRRRNSAPL